MSEMTEPTKPGFYVYGGGRQTLVFLLDHRGQWYAITDSATGSECEWGYIEQTLSVWSLVRLDSLTAGGPHERDAVDAATGERGGER